MTHRKSIALFDFKLCAWHSVIAGIVLSLPLLAGAESTKEIRMRVIESGTGKPVAGAEVRYRATAQEGTMTGHGGRYATLFDIKAESDANGTITIPPTKFDARIFGLFGMNTNYDNAMMTITRSGYESLELRNTLRIFPNLDEVIAWEHNGRTVELKPGHDKVRRPGFDAIDKLRDNPGAASIRSQQPMTIRKADDTIPRQRGVATQP